MSLLVCCGSCFMRMRHTSSSGETTPDALGQPLGAPHDGRVAANSALRRPRVLLGLGREILGLLVRPRRLPEIRPDVGDRPIVARQLGRRRGGDALADLAGDFRRRAAPRVLVAVLPDRIAGGDHGDLHAAAVLDPEGLARARLVRAVLEDEDRQQAVRFAGEDLVGLHGVGRVVAPEIEADDPRAGLLHHRPGAPRLRGQQFPAIGPLQGEQVGIIVSAAPFHEPIVVGARLERRTPSPAGRAAPVARSSRTSRRGSGRGPGLLQ